MLRYSAGDDYTSAACKVFRARRVKARESCVYVLGGSAIRELTADDAALSRAISSASGTNSRVWNLASSSQTLGGSLSLLERVPTCGRELFVVGVSVGRMASPLSDFEAEVLGNRAPGVAKISYDFVASRLDVPFFARFDAFAATMLARRAFKTHLLTNAGAADRGYIQHVYDTMGKPTEALIAEIRARIPPELVDGYRANHVANSVFLDWLVEAARRRGAELAFLEQPTNPLYHEMIRTEDDRHGETMTSRAHAAGVPYLRLETESLSPDDFYDLSHVFESGRAKVQPLLVNALAALIRKERDR